MKVGWRGGRPRYCGRPAAISILSLATVPVPRPAIRAVLRMPVPLASSRRAMASFSGCAPGRPSRLRTMPALETNLPSCSILAWGHGVNVGQPLGDMAPRLRAERSSKTALTARRTHAWEAP